MKKTPKLSKPVFGPVSRKYCFAHYYHGHHTCLLLPKKEYTGIMKNTFQPPFTPFQPI